MQQARCVAVLENSKAFSLTTFSSGKTEVPLLLTLLAYKFYYGEELINAASFHFLSMHIYLSFPALSFN